MKQFKDFGIKAEVHNFTGDKIKMSKILNREISVLDYRIEDSKYGNNNSKCLYMQIEIGVTKHVVFTGSTILIQMIQKIPKGEFPFKTTIIKEDDRFEFS